MDASHEPDACAQFAQVIEQTRYEQLPQATVDAARKSILDTLAVMAGAVGRSQALRGTVDLATEMGGRAEASLCGDGRKVPALMAAFVNGSLVHCLDYDDIEYESVYHPSGAVVPAALALAERGAPVSGKDFIRAVALGQDLGIRMARAIPAQRKPPWHRTVVIGTFAAAAAGAAILRLDAPRVVNALGHALNHAAGSLELRWGSGSEVGGMYCGLSAKAGVFSALLAQHGVPGVTRVFDGPAGFFKLYFDGQCRRDALLGGLGESFLGADTALKPWPACAATNTYVLATLNLMREHGLAAADIESITLHVGDYAVRNCEPLALRRRPPCAADAKFSLPWTVAVAAVHGDVRMQHFEPDALADPALAAMADRIRCEPDAAFDIAYGMPPGALRITTRDGRSVWRREDLPHGHPARPLSWGQLEAKALECLALAQHWLPAGAARELVDLCAGLEQAPDVSRLARLLRGPEV